MAKEFFVSTKFSNATLDMIDRISLILDEYSDAGYDLSLRQLYYQLVARGMIENSDKSYKRIGSIVNDARLAGLLDWSMIRDRGRPTVNNTHWTSPQEIIRATTWSFHLDRWENQNTHVEVMVEKQALEGVLIPVCRELDVPFTANKGYSSASALYDRGKRFQSILQHGKDVVILYLGDHDPSGIDMTRDVEERVKLFSNWNEFDRHMPGVFVDRLALNMSQVETLNPPPNPAKETDARFETYRHQFGDTCWELDAIEPSNLADLVRQGVYKYLDQSKLAEVVIRENEGKKLLSKVADQWDTVSKWLK